MKIMTKIEKYRGLVLMLPLMILKMKNDIWYLFRWWKMLRKNGLDGTQVEIH